MTAAACLSIAFLAGCGGGGGSGRPTAVPSIALAPVPIPPTPTPVPGRLEGVVYATAAVPAVAGVKVELMRVTASETAIAEGTTDGEGRFSIGLPSGEMPGANLLLRAVTDSGGTLRAFAVQGRTDITVGTETIVRELMQRVRTGALSWSDLQAGEIDAAQVMLTFHADALSSGEFADAQAHVAALRLRHAYRADWNWWLKGLPGVQPNPLSSGDIARIVTRTGGAQTGLPTSGDPARFAIQTSADGAPAAAWVMNSGMACEFPVFIGFDFAAEQSCKHGDTDLGIGRTNSPLLDPILLGDLILVGPGGLRISPSLPFLREDLRQFVVHAGPFRLLEFPWRVGSEFVFESNGLPAPLSTSLRVRRTVLPIERLQIDGQVVPALQVVLDLDVSASGANGTPDVQAFVRLRTWFSPELGRVQVSYEVRTASGADPVQRLDIVARRSDLAEFRSGARKPGPAVTAVAPVLAGTMSAEGVAITHERLAYAKASKRLYLTTTEASQSVVELDPATRATRSTVPLGGRILSLTVSADGSRVYAGMAGRESISEIRTADMSVVREIAFPLAADGFPYETAYAASVDPTDAGRLAVLVSRKGIASYIGGAVLIFNEGVREPARAPWPHENEGFGYYRATGLNWSSDGAHVLLWTGSNAYRLRTRVEPLQDEGWLDSFAAHSGPHFNVPSLDLAGSTWITPSGQVAAHDLSSQRLHKAPSGYGLGHCRAIDGREILCMDSSFASGGPNFLAIGVADGELTGLFVPDFSNVGCASAGLRSVVAVDPPLVIATIPCGGPDGTLPDRVVLMRLPGY